MPVSKPSSQPKTMLDTPIDVPVNDVRKDIPVNDIRKSGAFSPPAMLEQIKAEREQIKAERERLEQYTREQHARLSKLRELMLAEKAAAEKDLAARKEEVDRREQVLKNPMANPDLETLRRQIRQEEKATVDQLAAERDKAVAEVKKLHDQIAQWEQSKNERGAEAEKLVETLTHQLEES